MSRGPRRLFEHGTYNEANEVFERAIDMAVQPRRLGYEDYLEAPEDGCRYEIIEGELYVSPAPTTLHQGISQNLDFLLLGHIRSHKLGILRYAPCCVRLTPDEPVEPDLFFIVAERADIVGRDAVDGVPDVIIEILSPWKPRYDRVTKFNRYEAARVPEYWIVDPLNQTVEQFVLESGRYVRLAPLEDGMIGSRLIEGLRIPIVEIFAE